VNIYGESPTGTSPTTARFVIRELSSSTPSACGRPPPEMDKARKFTNLEQPPRPTLLAAKELSLLTSAHEIAWVQLHTPRRTVSPRRASHRLTAGPLSFADAWLLLQRTNPTLQAARAEVERRTAERAATRSLQQPQIDVSGRRHGSTALTINLDPIRDVILMLHPAVPAAAIPHSSRQSRAKRFFRAR